MVTMPADPPPSALRLDIDREALAGNWRALDRLSGKASAGAAVKADGYGLGAKDVVAVLREAGCRDFFVAHWSELTGLAALADPAMLSVLHGPMTTADAAYAKALGVKPVINSVDQARRWLEAGGGPCDLMVDTGINRLGLPLGHIGDEAIARLDIDVLMSHLASADEDVALNEIQLRRWQGVSSSIRHRRTSLANSAGIALGAAFHGNLTRPGLSLYGGIPREELRPHIHPVVRPMAAIIQVRDIAAGDSVGYNATFTACRPMRVGTIALGYADGYLRCWSGKGTFLSQGRSLPTLGRVSMDMTVIDLTAVDDVREGDWVEAGYDLTSSAAATGLSQYELLTLLGKRFGR